MYEQEFSSYVQKQSYQRVPPLVGLFCSVSMMITLVIGNKLLTWLNDQPAGDYDKTK